MCACPSAVPDLLTGEIAFARRSLSCLYPATIAAAYGFLCSGTTRRAPVPLNLDRDQCVAFAILLVRFKPVGEAWHRFQQGSSNPTRINAPILQKTLSKGTGLSKLYRSMRSPLARSTPPAKVQSDAVPDGVRHDLSGLSAGRGLCADRSLRPPSGLYEVSRRREARTADLVFGAILGHA